MKNSANTLSIDEIKSTEMDGKYLTFWTDGQLFGIPISDVVQIIGVQEITTIPEYPYYAKGIINVRGDIIPVVDMRLRFDKAETVCDEHTCILITSISEQLIGFLVESVNEVASISDANISPPPRMSEDSSNAYLTGVIRQDNKIILLLDTQRLVEIGSF